MEADAGQERERQSRLINALLKSDAYPHPVSSLTLLETHISWVILTGQFAYKIKKAVNLDFLDFSTLERRRHFCDEELRLNRQWAPQLYLEVVPIGGDYDSPTVGDEAEAIEFALKMVQFPQSARLDNQLNAGLLRGEHLHQLAETVAGYHANARVIEYANANESVRKVEVPMLDNFTPVEQAIDMELLRRTQAWTASRLRELKPVLVQRRRNGFVRECHGDLHLANLVSTSQGIVAFDCVEFSADLRNIDVLSDIAFLVMDLVAAARQDLAYAFLNRYLEATGDYAGMAVFDLYFVYHCMIRAKVAAIRSAERADACARHEDIEKLKHNIAVAIRWIDTAPPRLIAMHGYSGSGKTWVSSRLMTQLPAIRVRSDVERKRLCGIDEAADSHSEPGKGLYREGSRGRVYGALMTVAGRLLDAGFSVILDATFLRADERLLIADLAEQRRVSHLFVHTSSDRSVLEQRLRCRRLAGDDASEADVEVLDYQLETAEPLTPAELQRTLKLTSDPDLDTDALIKAIRSQPN